jgi:hypothetical protein
MGSIIELFDKSQHVNANVQAINILEFLSSERLGNARKY